MVNMTIHGHHNTSSQQMAEDMGFPSEGDRAELVDMLSAVADEQQMPSIPAPRINKVLQCTLWCYRLFCHHLLQHCTIHTPQHQASDPVSPPGSPSSWPSTPPPMTQFLMDDIPGGASMDPSGDEFDALLYGTPGDSSLPDLWRESDAQLTARLSAMPLDTLSIRELKAELKQLGMPTYGTRAVLLQRLEEAVHMLQQQEQGVEDESLSMGAEAGEYAAEAARVVQSMPLRQLQDELRGRGVDPKGTKSLMQDMLQQMLVKEMVAGVVEDDNTVCVLLCGRVGNLQYPLRVLHPC